MTDATPPPLLTNPFHLAQTITNIKTLIPTTLDIKNPNYQQLWASLTSLFTDNKYYRAIQLEEKSKSLKNGSFSIHDYC